MTRPFLFAAAMTLAVLPHAAQALPVAEPTDEKAAIEAVVDTFRAAIIAHDGKTLSALPLNDVITFTSVIDPQLLAMIRVKQPTAAKVTADTYPAFVKYIAGSKVPVEEKFSNLIIHQDGSIADVYFDYSFEENGVETNRGHESWGLVKTDAGWKIASVIWSISDPAPKAK